jgi:phospholipase/carboxylesterase
MLEHLVRPSSLKENYPLLVMLHGYGSSEEDLFSFASELPEEFIIISLKAPFPLQPYGNAWYSINFDAEKGKWNDVEEAKNSIKLIEAFINETLDNYPIDSSRVNLLGFSQGAILSYALSLSNPKLIKNIVGLSGYLDEKMILNDAEKKDFSHLNYYVSHGTQDMVIPFDWSLKTIETFNKKGLKIESHSYEVGHGVNPQNFRDFKDFLIKNN